MSIGVSKSGSHISKNGNCAILNGTNGKRWWQPTDCFKNYRFYCVITNTGISSSN